MGDFNNSLKYAEEFLKDYTYLLDYNSIASKDLPVAGYMSKENVWLRTFKPLKYFFSLSYSNDLLALYNKEEDLRIKFYGQENPSLPEGMLEYNFRAVETNMLISTPDILLIRAECYAQAGNLQKAMQDLDLIRKNRIKSESFKAYYPSNVPKTKGEALELISQERRRETAFSGMNLWDQKRYHAQGRIVKTFTRDIMGKEYVLAPGSTKYYQDIAVSVMRKNPNIKNNK